MTDHTKLQSGQLRMVSPKRARKLRKRGVKVRWSTALYSYVWERG